MLSFKRQKLKKLDIEKETNELPQDIMDLLTEAFAISEKSLDLNISYEDLLNNLNIYLNDNVIDRKVDDARENGVFSLPTSKPNEFKSEGQLITKEKPYLEARFSFIQKISDNPIKRNNINY